MTFGNWSEDVHESEAQQKRMASAASSALTPLDVNYKDKTATFSGHRGVYQTSFDLCSCGDFLSRHLPCKHIYRLAHEILHIDLGRTVMYNADDVVNPDTEDRADKAIRIGLVIDEQPESSYAAILSVLRAIKELGRPQSTINSAIEQLEFKMQSKKIASSISTDGILYLGKTFVLTGEFSLFTREEAMGWLESKGAKVSGSLSSKTNYLIIGQNPNNGKLRRAEAMDIPVLSEQDLLTALQQ